MKAVQILKGDLGDPQVSLRQTSKPNVSNKSALVRVRASSLNHRELLMYGGRHPGFSTTPLIPGSDVAGELVTALPEFGIPAGSPVVVAPGLSCGACTACREGRENECPSYRIIAGAQAEYIAVPRQNIIPIDGIEPSHAACLPVAYLTAWHMVVTRGRIIPGESVLVTGASGGVGTAAVQIAIAMGAQVIALVGSPSKAKRLQSLGPILTLQRNHPNWQDQAKELGGGKGVDVVIETVGHPMVESCLEILRPGGRLMLCGAHGGSQVNLDLWSLFRRSITIYGCRMGTASEMRRLVETVRLRQIIPLIDRIFRMEDVAAAYQYFARSEHVGKVVLTMGSP